MYNFCVIDYCYCIVNTNKMIHKIYVSVIIDFLMLTYYNVLTCYTTKYNH